MNYKELFKAAETFRKNYAWDSVYFRAKGEIDWRNLHTVSSDEVKRVVLGFLNNWNCRIPVTDALAERIKSTHRQAIPYLNALNDETLEDIDFHKKKNVIGEQLWNSRIIHIVFSMFSNIGDRFRWVAASKVLHMINPKIFVMWDNAICDAYEVDINASSYANEFLPLMKNEVNEAINTYMEEQKCSRDEAIKQIESKFDGKTLAKLIDEYNWLKYTVKII